MPQLVVILCCALLVPAAAAAQAGHSPYAHDRSAEVRTLTTAEVEALLTGDGMGLARPAELNHYPGPRHVIELTDSLALTPSRAEAVRSIFAAMEAEAMAVGRRVLEAERELDAYFAAGDASEAGVAERVRAVAVARADLRLVHLLAHIETRRQLSEHQVHLYDRLRGYGDGGHDHGDAH